LPGDTPDHGAWYAAATRLAAPPFAPLAPLLAELPRERWPNADDLNRLARKRLPVRDPPFTFVPAAAAKKDALNYEERIHSRGEIVTRDNWHDLFNALAWLAYPEVKQAINARHAQLLAAGGERERRQRSPARDALTLFDEGGMIVLCEEPQLLDLIRNFQWRALFVERRAAVEAQMTFLLVGHAVYEKMLDPYSGITCKCLLLRTLREAPQCLMTLAAPRALAPLPILGIPGWCAENAFPDYYEDTAQFRPGWRRA
jgi:hypothetical protein